MTLFFNPVFLKTPLSFLPETSFNMEYISYTKNL